MTSKIKNFTMARDSAYLREPVPRSLQLRLGWIRPNLLDRCCAAWRGLRSGFLTGYLP
jgi:hypothetical protein